MELNRSSKLGTVATTLLAPLAWGSTYVTVTELLPADRPLFTATMRVAPAGLLLVVVGALSPPRRPSGAEWLRTAILSLFNFVLFFPLLVAAVYRLPGGVAAAVGGLQPLLVAALSWRLIGTHPERRDLLIGGVAAIGVGLVVVRPGAGLDPVGLLLAAAANVSFAIGVVLTKKFPTPKNRLSSTGWQLALGAAMLIPIATVVEGAPPTMSPMNLVGFAYLSIFGTAIAFMFWFNGIRRLPATAPPLLGLAGPITGATLGWLVLGQSLSRLQLVGFVVTIAAIGYGATLRAGAGDDNPITADGPRPSVTVGSRPHQESECAHAERLHRPHHPPLPDGRRRSRRCDQAVPDCT